LVKEHLFFRDLLAHLTATIENRDIRCLDDLVAASRRPVRTVLLGLHELIRTRVVVIGPSAITLADGGDEVGTAVRRPDNSVAGPRLAAHVGRYLELTATREAPALLWGQRRLVPHSALRRADYVLEWMAPRRGVAMFFGDDDMVSPLVAAGAPGWQVHVVDIDRGVLDTAERTAAALGARVQVHHADLATTALAFEGACDVTVCDPFPSGDGSFEAVFWSQATSVLRPGGLSITTVAPSHKPLGYAQGALRRQQELGLDLLDLRADFGWYESFAFEFTSLECEWLSTHNLRSSVSQTKSIMAARLAAGPRAPSPAFDFGRWSSATTDHYLTRQAGLDEQQALARARGAGGDVSSEAAPRRGMRTDLLVPSELRAGLPASSEESAGRRWTELLTSLGADPSQDDVAEIVRLTEVADLAPSGPNALLGLAIRAIESWERWRLDV
jgi:hypothetical protein